MNKVPDSTVKNLMAMTTLESAQQLHAIARGLCCKMSFMQRKPYLARFMWTSKSDVYNRNCANNESVSLRPWFIEKSRGFSPTHTESYTPEIGIRVHIRSFARRSFFDKGNNQIGTKCFRGFFQMPGYDHDMNWNAHFANEIIHFRSVNVSLTKAVRHLTRLPRRWPAAQKVIWISGFPIRYAIRQMFTWTSNWLQTWLTSWLNSPSCNQTLPADWLSGQTDRQ